MKQDIQMSIMIIYDQEKHIEVNYLIAFWKWLGIMVTERTFQSIPFVEEKLQQEHNFFDCTFVIGTPPKEFTNSFSHNSIILAKEIYSLQNDPVKIDKWIKKYSQIILSCDQIDDLVDLYRKYECYKMDLIIELNHERGKLIKIDEETKNETWQIIDKLKKLITEVKKLSNQVEKSANFLCYKKYIEASNMHKVNLLLSKDLGYNHNYSVETPTEILIAITDLMPKFSSAYIKIAEIMKTTNYRTSIYPYYIKAIKSRENAPFLSDTYLDIKGYRQDRMQLQATRQLKDLNELVSYCQKAFELNPINYKAYFQHAQLMLDLKKTRTTIHNYENTIDILNLLAPLNQLSPIELDYMLRSYALIGMIYNHYWSDPLREIYQINKAKSIKEWYLKNNLFSPYYFFDNSTYFKKKLLVKTKYLEDI